MPRNNATTSHGRATTSHGGAPRHHSKLWALGTALALCIPFSAHADTAFLGEVNCGGYNFCPVNTLECNGQVLPISQYSALFALLGTYYGGNGTSNFALPNLQSRTMVGQGQGPGLSSRVVGEESGSETVTVLTSQMPLHTHALQAHNGTDEKSASPAGNIAGTAPATANVYASVAPNTQLHPSAMSYMGGNQPHNNLQPYLAVKCCITTAGVFPARQ